MRPLLPVAALLACLLGGGPAHAAPDAPVPTEPPTEVPAPAPSSGIGLTAGVSVGGGTLVGGIVQLQVSRALFLEADLGYRGGWDLGERYYPNLALGVGMSAQFGRRPWRNGFFVNLASTLPAAFHEVWVGVGWSARVWNKDDTRSFTMDLGPAVYLVRDLPYGTDLDEVPLFVHARVAWHFPLVHRAGNTSERPPKPPRRARERNASEADPAAPEPTGPPPG